MVKTRQFPVKIFPNKPIQVPLVTFRIEIFNGAPETDK